MRKEQEDAVLRITAQYVAEVQAGAQPQVRDYLARYPQYAGAIADFVAYYHAVELAVTDDASSTADGGVLPHMDHAEEDVQMYSRRSRSAKRLTSLLSGARKRRLSVEQFAARLELSEELLLLLEQRALEPSTLPHALIQRIARTLNLSDVAVQSYLTSAPWSAGASSMGPSGGARSKVAEPRSPYPAPAQPPARQSFRDALQASTQLSAEQRAAWETLLTAEQL